MSNANLTRTESGKYTGTICGVSVRVARSSVGENAYGQKSCRVEWKVRVEGLGVIADGHGTMVGAVEAAERSIQFRGMAK